jgi:cellulose synthase/poly-beta-1,6-N-acetylglucosamine synthase-like glycosyltransferase
MTAQPEVSIVVGVRNCEGTVGAAIESLLAQTYPKDRYEIILVDNESTDRTSDIIARYPVKALFEDRGHSAAHARNRGIREASGEIVAFTDGDCIAHPDWLASGLAGFTEPRIGCVAGEIEAHPPKIFAQHYAERHKALSQTYTLTQAFKPYPQTANAFYRRSVLEELRYFDTSLVIVEDADLAWRMQDELGLTIAFRPEAIVYHQHRETLRELLRQRRGYGVLLYRKYRQQMGRPTIKKTYWELLGLRRRAGHLVGALAAGVFSGSNGRSRWEPARTAWVDLRCAIAVKMGQLDGSIKHRIWYV